MKCMQSITGVLAIVGLGYIAGVGHSLIRTKPVILGGSALIAPVSDVPIKAPDEPVATDLTTGPTTDSATGEPDADPKKSAHDMLLDAPVPAGMLTLRQAHQMWLDGAYFIDSRLEHEYQEGHISLAAYLTTDTIFTDAGETEMQSIPPDAQVVIYCLGGDECDASLNTKAILEQFGYTNLAIMGVGYDEWAAAGLPTNLTENEDSP
ncbi:MAG: hypothetical protein JKX70_02880 [Phycisphaerales bacterium]|nr:hypothetical protein [Phycisphaerales bacterium]